MCDGVISLGLRYRAHILGLISAGDIRESDSSSEKSQVRWSQVCRPNVRLDLERNHLFRVFPPPSFNLSANDDHPPSGLQPLFSHLSRICEALDEIVNGSGEWCAALCLAN